MASSPRTKGLSVAPPGKELVEFGMNLDMFFGIYAGVQRRYSTDFPASVLHHPHMRS